MSKNSNLIELKKVKTNWDLSVFYKSPNDKNIEKDIKIVEKNVDSFVAKWKNNNEYTKDPKILSDTLKDLETLEKTTSVDGKFGYFAYLGSDLDQNNTSFKALNSKVNSFIAKQANKLTFLEQNISKITDQEKFLNSLHLKEYKHFLLTIFKNAKYLLSEKEENLLNLLYKSSKSNWVEMTEQFINKYNKKTLDEQGKLTKKTFEQTLSLTNSINEKVRDAAAKNIYSYLKKLAPIAEHEINSILYTKKTTDTLRGYTRPEMSRFVGDDIDPEVVDTLINELINSYSICHRYYAFKAALFKKKRLKIYERNVPYITKEERVEFNQALSIVASVFNNVDGEFLQIIKDMFYSGRVDVYPKVGKNGGGYCVANNINDPIFILLNYTNKLEDTKTLAHEFGHCVNYYLMKKTCNPINYGNSTSLAEVASKFFEDLTLTTLLNNVNDEHRLSLLIKQVDDTMGSIYTQARYFAFEQELHNTFAEKNYLNHKQISSLFLKHTKKQMGSSIEYTLNSENSWIYVSHFRRYFYVYSYASGLLISKFLLKQYYKNPQFIKEIKMFLQTGTQMSPKEIFLKLGVNISSKEFWQEGIKEVDLMVNEVIALAKKLKKI